MSSEEKAKRRASAKKKREKALKEPRFWPLVYVCKSRKLDKFIDHLTSRIPPNKSKKKTRKMHMAQLKATLRLIVLNLYVVYKISPEASLILPSAAGAYNKGSRLRETGIHGADYVKKLMNAKVLGRYAEKRSGYYQRSVGEDDSAKSRQKKKTSGRATSYSPQSYFIPEVERFISLDSIKQKPILTNDLVVLKQRKRNLNNAEKGAVYEAKTEAELNKTHEDGRIKFRANDEVRQTRKLLENYNKLLSSAELGFKPTESESSHIPAGLWPNTLQRQTYQILTSVSGKNTDLNHHGRFYGGFWVTLKSNLRKHILIDGKATIELDFRSMHPLLLYIEKGAPLPRECKLKGGAYDLYSSLKFDGFEAGVKQHRQLAKKLMSVAINNSSPEDAINTIHSFYSRNKGKAGFTCPQLKEGAAQKKTLTEALNTLIERHKLIEDSLFKDAGMRLMHLDARIAEKVIKHFTNKQEVVLTIHDSFILRAELETELKAVMLSNLLEIPSKTKEIPLLKAEEVIKKEF